MEIGSWQATVLKFHSEVHESLNPLKLKQELDILRKKVFEIQKTGVGNRKHFSPFGDSYTKLPTNLKYVPNLMGSISRKFQA